MDFKSNNGLLFMRCKEYFKSFCYDRYPTSLLQSGVCILGTFVLSSVRRHSCQYLFLTSRFSKSGCYAHALHSPPPLSIDCFIWAYTLFTFNLACVTCLRHPVRRTYTLEILIGHFNPFEISPILAAICIPLHTWSLYELF